MTEQRFTDEDLKRWKNKIQKPLPDEFALMPALLARLEAAEKALMNSEYQEVNEYFEAWRQAAGK